MALKIGDTAPAFTLTDTERKPRSLKEFLGKKTVVVFFPGAFTGVCTKELCSFRDSMVAFNDLDANVVAISVDSPFANKGFSDHNKFGFPVLSDYTREVSRVYTGIQEDFAGLKGYQASKRSVFVLDANGVVKYAWISDNPGVEPDYDQVKHSLTTF